MPSHPTSRPDAIHVWQLPWQHRNAQDGALPVVAAFLGVPLDNLRLVMGEHGKPTLASPFTDVGFSWSHSGEHALLALGVGIAEVGIDIERRRPRPRLLELARRFFAAEEAEALASLPDAERLTGFLSLWTAKEAVLKAHGGGLVYGLHRVMFDVTDALRPTLFEGDIGPASHWHVQPLAVTDGFHAHLAWRGPSRTIIFMNELEPRPEAPV